MTKVILNRHFFTYSSNACCCALFTQMSMILMLIIRSLNWTNTCYKFNMFLIHVLIYIIGVLCVDVDSELGTWNSRKKKANERIRTTHCWKRWSIYVKCIADWYATGVFLLFCFLEEEVRFFLFCFYFVSITIFLF